MTEQIADDQYWRQLDIITPEQLRRYGYQLIGAGGIGSWAALELTKMGVSGILTYDADKVELHNISNTIYRDSDIGKPKVQALKEIIKMLSGADIFPIESNYTPDTMPLDGIIICGVDSMAARQQIWQSVKSSESHVDLYVDGRMGGQIALVYAVRPNNTDEVQAYEKTLHSDENAAVEPCTNRAVVYNTALIGALIARQVREFAATGQPVKTEWISDIANGIWL